MQHSWNELSESTKNFIKNKELQEAYISGYNSLINEAGRGRGGRFRRVVKPGQADDFMPGTPLIRGPGINAAPSNITGPLAALYNTLPQSILDAIGGPNGPLAALADLLAGDNTMLNALYALLSAIGEGGKNMQDRLQVWSRLFRRLGWEMRDDGYGTIGLFPIPDFPGINAGHMDMEFPEFGVTGWSILEGDPQSIQDFENWMEIMADMFEDLQIPYNSDLAPPDIRGLGDLLDDIPPGDIPPGF